MQHRAAPTRRCRPTVPPRGHPQGEAPVLEPHVFAQVAGGVQLGDSVPDPQPIPMYQGKPMSYYFVQGSFRPVMGVARPVQPLIRCDMMPL